MTVITEREDGMIWSAGRWITREQYDAEEREFDARAQEALLDPRWPEWRDECIAGDVTGAKRKIELAYQLCRFMKKHGYWPRVLDIQDTVSFIGKHQ